MKNHRFPWLRNRTTDNRKCEKACNIKEKRTIEMFSTVSRQPVELLSSASVNRPFYIFFHLQKDLLFFCRTCRRITRSRNSISGTFCVLLKGRRKEKWLFEMLISCIPLRSMSKMVSCWYFRTVARSAYLWKRSLETDHLPKNRQSGRMPASAGSGRRGESGVDPESYAGGRGRQCRGQRGKALFLLLWTKTQPQDRESTQQPPELRVCYHPEQHNQGTLFDRTQPRDRPASYKPVQCLQPGGRPDRAFPAYDRPAGPFLSIGQYPPGLS